ncbi:MAG TPA: hypothetical protein VNO21_09845 [Polyangiaceae bacterium]|nr:hypothetical protein [Polyangiaceae bacterium]
MMMPSTRRASLLVAFYMLTSAATAYAECAWVLWQQQGEISPSGVVSSSDWTWLTAEATSTEAECRQVSARFDATLGPKDADGYSSVTSKGKKVRVRNVCLPDGTDPRGPKGK